MKPTFFSRFSAFFCSFSHLKKKAKTAIPYTTFNPQNGSQMKPTFFSRFSAFFCSFSHLKKKAKTAIPYTTFNPQNGPQMKPTFFPVSAHFSKQLPNSHPYDYRHPYNHRKVHQNGPQMAPTFCARFHIFKTTPEQPSM